MCATFPRPVRFPVNPLRDQTGQVCRELERKGASCELELRRPASHRSETPLNCSAGRPYPALARQLLTQGQMAGYYTGTAAAFAPSR